MLKTLIAAAFLVGMANTASAVPTAQPAGVRAADTGAFIQVAKRDRKRHWRHRHRGRHWRHHNRHRWQGPPPGWRRHHARPWDWRRRGCILFGPVWFCP